jgi:class 3 adenylate cyclase
LYQRLRDLSQRTNDFATYIQFNDAYHQLKEQIAGADASVRVAMIRKEREIENMEQERARERAVLYSTLPKHIADRVIRGEQVSDHFEAVGVMFLDIVGFTTISSELSSSEVVRILDAVFETCDAICAANHVTKIKTIGDSYMAVAFVDTETGRSVPATNLANAALDILDAVQHLDLRIGLHYGPVTAGVLGKDRLQYDVWGDTVNVASRMESTSEPGRIHVSEAFAAALDSERANEHLSLLPRGEMEIKGKGLMNTFWLAR